MIGEELSSGHEDADEVISRWDNIFKSSKDRWKYRGIELKNRLKALLVSDPTVTNCVLSISVHVGSFADPEYLPGLARLCERMLCVKSEKYPYKREFYNFLSEHGGSNTSYTENEYTTFFFDVNNKHLNAAAEMFSQFFKCPLFPIEYFDRAIEFINKAYKDNRLTDYYRLDYLIKSMANPDNPFHKFASGNHASLVTTPKEKKIDLHAELLKFYSKWYSPNIMNMIVFGAGNLDELEKIVIDNFASIQNKHVQLPEWPLPLFYPENLKKQIKLVPCENVNELTVIFPISDMTKFYTCSPVRYINNFLSREEPGSLIHLLRENGWGSEIFLTSNKICARGFDIFEIHIKLVEEGNEHIDDIVCLIFQYLNLMRKEGVQKWIFDEHTRLDDIEFQHTDEELPVSFALSFVHNLSDYPMKHVISANQISIAWKPDVIHEVLNMLTPENMQLYLPGKRFEPECDQEEKWYGIKYKAEDIPEEKIKKWTECGLNGKMSINQPNPFIVDSMDLLPCDPEETKEYPEMVYDSPVLRVWHKQDSDLVLPKLNMFFNFLCPIVNKGPLNNELTEIFLLLLLDALSQTKYAAQLTRLVFSIEKQDCGLAVTTTGFDSKQHFLIEHITEKMLNLKVDPARFDIMKKKRIKSLENFENRSRFVQGFHYMNLMLKEKFWTIEELLQAADGITAETQQKFIENFLMNVHIECLLTGNITKERAIRIAKIAEKNLPKNVTPLSPEQFTFQREIQLAQGNFRLEVVRKINTNACTILYYQSGLETPLRNVLLQLLMRIIDRNCYHVLKPKKKRDRTKPFVSDFTDEDPIGRYVCPYIRKVNGVQGLVMIIHSQKHPKEVEWRIDALLNHMDKHITKMDDEAFENCIESMIQDKQRDTKCFMDRFSMYTSEISNQEYCFDRYKSEIEIIKTVTKTQLYEYYKEILDFSSPNRKKISIHLTPLPEIATPDAGEYSNESEELSNYLPGPKDPTEVTLIENITAFKSERPLFPEPPPNTDVPPKGVGGDV